MARVVGQHGVPVVIMHNRYKAEPAINIVSDINAFFDYSLDIADKAGIPRDAIVLDPGIGFGKTPEQSMEAIAKLGKFKHFGLPILVGASRKRFINSVSPSEPMDRIGGSIAAHVMAYMNGADMIRTHDVRRDHPGAAGRCRLAGPSNDRSGVRQRPRAARLSRRDAARGQGRPELQRSISSSTSISTQASRSDKLADTVGYDQVVDVASKAFGAKRYRLVEAAAGAVADAVLTRFRQVTAIRVTIHKPHAPIAATFERRRRLDLPQAPRSKNG